MATLTDLRVRSLQESGHPLYNNRKLKLGTFTSNTSGGLAMSTVEGRAQADWPMNQAIAQIADEMTFEAQVPVGRWRGFGGKTNHSAKSLEVYTWAAGLGATTRYSSIFATSHYSVTHPVLAAKQGATIDHISNGRFALNLVCSWRPTEMAMFGQTVRSNDERYAAADEWLEIVKRLWSDSEPFDYEGKYYRMQQAIAEPKPICKPYPPIMNAGTSEIGRHFAARNCDVAFVAARSNDELRAQVQAYRELARQEYGREISIWTYGYIVQGETEAEARSLYNHYVHEKGDWQAAENAAIEAGMKASVPKDQWTAILEGIVAGHGSTGMIGAPEHVAENFVELAKTGVDGILLTWPRYLEGIRAFQERTLPLLRQAGLR